MKRLKEFFKRKPKLGVEKPVPRMSDKEYEDRRKDLIRIRESSMDSFSKAMLQVSLAGLAIIFTIATKEHLVFGPFSLLLLGITIGSLAAIAILILLGLSFSKKSMDFKIDDLDKRWVEGWEKQEIPAEKFSKFRTAASVCVLMAVTFLIIAVISFGSYSFLTIRSRQYFNKEQVGSMSEGKEKSKPASHGKSSGPRPSVPLKRIDGLHESTGGRYAAHDSSDGKTYKIVNEAPEAPRRPISKPSDSGSN